MKAFIEQDSITLDIETGPLTRVTVHDLYYELKANGYAKCTPEDTYSEKFGIELATARANARLNTKRIKELIRESEMFANGAT